MNVACPKQTCPRGEHSIDRRTLLIGAAGASAGLLAWPLWRRWRHERAPVFLAAGQRYDGQLTRTIEDGLTAVGVAPAQVKGKRVLLKPNLVEPNHDVPQMTTHPMVVVAAADVFRRWGADVVIGEGPGHVRDTELALFESGMDDALRTARLPFADLNYEDLGRVANAGRVSPLDHIYLPRSVLEADMIVSMPKLKTHHWMGMTAAMKNLYGVLPGIKYGWPKNVLHHAGIPQTVFDINASLPTTIALVDGILCMEGDGPIMGTPKPMGILAIGTSLPAVDATCARIMGLLPDQIPYLTLAANRLGPIEEGDIEQRGEWWQSLADPFEILDYPHLRHLRADRTASESTPRSDRLSRIQLAKPSEQARCNTV